MAILGEVSCLLAAVVGLPALVSWSRRRAAEPRPVAVEEDASQMLLVPDTTRVASS
jgi:hypothetical protein